MFSLSIKIQFKVEKDELQGALEEYFERQIYRYLVITDTVIAMTMRP